MPKGRNGSLWLMMMVMMMVLLLVMLLLLLLYGSRGAWPGCLLVRCDLHLHATLRVLTVLGDRLVELLQDLRIVLCDMNQFVLARRVEAGNADQLLRLLRLLLLLLLGHMIRYRSPWYLRRRC